VKIRLQGFETHSRARTLEHPTDDARPLAQAAIELLRDFAPRRPLRLLGLRATSLLERDGALRQSNLDAWPADILGESPPWRPRQRRIDER
jgi:DNA polymerase-4